MNRRGQSTVEYILLVAGVVAVVIIFTTSRGDNSFHSRLTNVFNEASEGMIDVANRVTTVNDL